MKWVNKTWPHPAHQFFNRAAGASNPSLATHCLASHMVPGTDLLVVDFDLSSWQAQHQEWLARSVALMPRPPLTVYLNLVKWCAPWVEPSKKELRREIERLKNATAARLDRSRWSVADWKRELEHSDCKANIQANRVPQDNPVGASVARVARRYGQVVVDVFGALAPLVGKLDRSPFENVRDWTMDGVHGYYNRHGVSVYVNALGEMLSEVLMAAMRAQNSGKFTLQEGMTDTGMGEHIAEELPPPMKLGAGAWGASATPRTLACYGWLSRNLRAPRTLASGKQAAEGQGWFVSEVTLHGAKRKKPGLVSLDRGDTVDLEVATEARGRARVDGVFATFCVGLTYLQSYEHMGRVVVTCLAPCACQRTVIDALEKRSRTSLFHAVEIPLSSAASTCVLRLYNLGVRPTQLGGHSNRAQGPPAEATPQRASPPPPLPSAAVHGAHSAPARAANCDVPPCEMLANRPISKFRLAGIYVAEMWVSANSSAGGHVDHAAAGSRHHEHGVCMLDARRQDLNDYGDFETPKRWLDKQRDERDQS